MPVMKALKSFRVGETKETVSPGTEFSVSAGVARDYEKRGMAIEIKTLAARAARAKPQPVENRASAGGPLDFPGGATGGETSPLLSPAAPARKTRVSKKPAGGLDL